MKRFAFSLFALPLFLSAFSCADTLPSAPDKTQKTPTVAVEDLPRHVADISDKRCDELSGLAASRRYPGFLWAHNDSGDSARLFLVEEKTGRVAAVVNIVNAVALDWEDIAIAGSGDKAQIYLGDIGDNLELRPFISIYRLNEPIIDISARQTVEIKASAQTLILRYPDAPHNAETLLANARGELLIATKVGGKTQFFGTPQVFGNGGMQTLEIAGCASVRLDGARTAQRAGDAHDRRRFVARWQTRRDYYVQTKRWCGTWAKIGRRCGHKHRKFTSCPR